MAEFDGGRARWDKGSSSGIVCGGAEKRSDVAGNQLSKRSFNAERSSALVQASLLAYVSGYVQFLHKGTRFNVCILLVLPKSCYTVQLVLCLGNTGKGHFVGSKRLKTVFFLTICHFLPYAVVQG